MVRIPSSNEMKRPSVSKRRKSMGAMRDALKEGRYDDSTIQAVYRLASDSDRGVRQDVAALIHHLPQEDFQRLVDRFLCDSNSYVRSAAESALKQRQKQRREAQRRRKEADWIQAQTDSLQKQFGKRAGGKILRVAERRCGLIMGSVVHNMDETMSLVGYHLYKAFGQLEGNRASLRHTLKKMEELLLFLDKHFADMRAYAKPAPLRYGRESLADVVAEAQSKAVSGLREKSRDPANVSINVSIPGNITAEISRHNVVTALVNVIKNAIESHANGPTTFASGAVEVCARIVDQGIEIEVTDDGIGIEADDLLEVRQFLLGRTTKKNHGTGFGLPIAEQNVAAHGGSIHIDSKAGQGTTVTIRLPQNQR